MELNPNHPTTQAVHDQWHKLLAALMLKLEQEHVILSIDDILKLESGVNIAVQELKDGIHLRLIDNQQAERMLKVHGDTPIQEPQRPSTLTTDRNDPRLKETREDGMNKAYLVLSEEERAKGFVRPLRHSYTHVGLAGPRFPLRDLTDYEKELYAEFKYVKFEQYPESESPLTGKFWTNATLESIGKGCGTTTGMSRPLAETYARNPKFYGLTFCAHCRRHLPVAEFVWADTNIRLGT